MGEYKSVVCVYRAIDDCRFLSFSTGRAELAWLLETHRPGVVLIEACVLAGWVCDLCAEKGAKCLVANTTSEAWKFKHLTPKADSWLHEAETRIVECMPKASGHRQGDVVEVPQ